jgi:predicted Zn-dependent protease
MQQVKKQAARTAASLVFACFALSLTVAQAASPDGALLRATGLCGSLDNAFGPYDYRTAPADKIGIVERFHFTPAVEALQHGNTGKIGSDIDYTLRAFPNHPRALYAMAKHALLLRASRTPGAKYPAECYFDRAIRFAPDDAQVRALYADFLIRLKRPKDAEKQLEIAEKLKTTPQVAYNLALAWANLGENAKALPLAKRAYAGGIAFPGLRDKLKAAGAWRD